MTVQSRAATETLLHTFVDTSTNENGGTISGLAAGEEGPLDRSCGGRFGRNVFGATFYGGQIGVCPAGCGVIFEIIL